MILPPICTLSSSNPYKMGDIPQWERNTSSTEQKKFIGALQIDNVIA
jgi:hypothetical protein